MDSGCGCQACLPKASSSCAACYVHTPRTAREKIRLPGYPVIYENGPWPPCILLQATQTLRIARIWRSTWASLGRNPKRLTVVAAASHTGVPWYIYDR
jgi:hypothetical protein